MTVTVARNRLECCRPFLRYTGPPELYTWSHSLFCKEHSGARLSDAELELAQPKAPEPKRYPDGEQRAHQRQAERDLDETGCPAHGGFRPWRDCPGCAAEVDAFKERDSKLAFTRAGGRKE